MQILPFIYFTYMFISFYLLVFTILLYLKNKKVLFFSPPLTKNYSLSVLVPAYNESKTIADTIEHIFDSDYPVTEVLVVNDGSTDNTLLVLKGLISKYKGKLKILNKENSGKADSLNKALKFAKGELIAVVDADSYPSKTAFTKLIGFFDNPNVGITTAACIPRNRRTLLEKMQVIEYKVIAFTRKLLGYVDSIYVAPGSLSVYRKKAVLDVGGFDTKNITEDVEMTWRLLRGGWDVKMALGAIVTTTTPNKIKSWFVQRRRWSVGGLQTLIKYKKSLMRHGMLGYFIVPYFAMGFILGLLGLGILAYLTTRRVLRNYLLAKYSIELGVPVLTMNELLITPSVLNYFGIVLFVLFLFFTLFVLAIMKDSVLEKQSFFNLMFYMTIYLLIYPITTILAVDHVIRGKMVWR